MLFTPKEVAEQLRVSTMSVWRWIKSERLHAVKIGKQLRISNEEIERVKREGL